MKKERVKQATCFPVKPRRPKWALVIAGGLLAAGPANAAESNMIQDNTRSEAKYYGRSCVDSAMGITSNIDCSRGRVNRDTYDMNAYNTDTGQLNGSLQKRTHSPAVDPRDGMTAQSLN